MTLLVVLWVGLIAALLMADIAIQIFGDEQ